MSPRGISGRGGILYINMEPEGKGPFSQNTSKTKFLQLFKILLKYNTCKYNIRNK